ncbi:MAG: polysaccharide deacetylase family protein [Polyangiaceae bacterium]|nr:polysaccharide deacetylase family protein [Polyangiaceae bacterium]
MQRNLFLTAVLAAGIALTACGTDPSPKVHDEPTARTAEAVFATDDIDGTSLPDKTLAFTFDDGPGPQAKNISAYLRDQGIRAVFFVIGEHIAKSQTLPTTTDVVPGAAGILTQIALDGHLIANHATSHRDLTTLSSANVIAEVTETDNDIAPYTQPNKLLFRAPEGAWNKTVANTLNGSPMSKYIGPIYWDMGGLTDNYPNAAADWACWQGQMKGNKTYTPDQCGQAYLNEIRSTRKGIVLMHDLDGYEQNTLDMLTIIVPTLKQEGYSFVRLDEVPDIAKKLPVQCNASCATCTGPGADQCDSCAAGKFLAAGTCTACSTCANGSYQAASCNASTDTVCAPCDASCATCTGPAATDCVTCAAGRTSHAGVCAACTQCGSGSYVASQCTEAADTVCASCDESCTTCSGPLESDCGSCGAGRYLHDGECVTCTQCKAGNYVASACTDTVDTVCQPCAPGTSSATDDASECTSCGNCDDGDECTVDSCDAVRGCVHVADPTCQARKDAGVDEGATSDSGDQTAHDQAQPGIGGDAGTSGTSDLDSAVSSAKGSGCSVGHASGGQGAIALVGALAWVLVLRRRRSAA